MEDQAGFSAPHLRFCYSHARRPMAFSRPSRRRGRAGSVRISCFGEVVLDERVELGDAPTWRSTRYTRPWSLTGVSLSATRPLMRFATSWRVPSSQF